MGTSRAPRAGEIVCGFRLLQELGSRGGRSYIASRASAASDSRSIVELFDESTSLAGSARALTRVRHPNLVGVRDVVVDSGFVAVECEAVDGEWLDDLLADGAARMPLGTHLRVIVDVLEGLSALHDARAASGEPAGLLHGEVAPAHILIGADGTARLAHPLRGPAADPSPYVIGYLAPEVLLRDHTADSRADLFSAGVLLWEALTGQRLHATTNIGEIVVRLLGGKVQLAEPPKDAPWAARLGQVAKRALSLDVAARYPSAAEMAGAIRREAGAHLASKQDLRTLVESLAGAASAQPLAPAAAPARPKPPAAPRPARTSAPPRAQAAAPENAAESIPIAIGRESERPTAPPPPSAAAGARAAPAPPRIPRLSVPTPAVPITALPPAVRAAVSPEPSPAPAVAMARPAPPVAPALPAPAVAMGPPAPAVAEKQPMPPASVPPSRPAPVAVIAPQVLSPASSRAAAPPPPPAATAAAPPAPSASLAAPSALPMTRTTPTPEPISLHEATGAPVALWPDTDAPVGRPRRRRAVILAAALIVVPALALLIRITVTSERASSGAQPGAGSDHVGAAVQSPPVPEPAPAARSPQSAAPPTDGDGSSRASRGDTATVDRAPPDAPARAEAPRRADPPAGASPAPSASGATDVVAPPPLRKPPKKSYLPLGI